jgi:hypothetical protein
LYNLKSPESANREAGVEVFFGRRIWGELLHLPDVKISRIGQVSCITEVQVIVSAVQLAQLSKHLKQQNRTSVVNEVWNEHMGVNTEPQKM